MKYSVLLCLFWFACKSGAGNNIQNTIPGIYVRVINHEFANGYDTLIVKQLHEPMTTFSIVKKAGFVQFVDGKTIGRKTTAEKFTAVYDETTGTLNDNHKMKSFTPIPEKGVLLIGSMEYKKVIKR